MSDEKLTRRGFLRASALAVASGALIRSGSAQVVASSNTKVVASLEGEVGITIACLTYQRRADPTLREYPLEALPRILKNEIGLRVIDLNTRWIKSSDRAYLDRARNAAEREGCQFTNVKMNSVTGSIYSPDPVIRSAALSDRKEIIDAAAILGARWVRPDAPRLRKDKTIDVSGHQILAEYAEAKKVGILIENNGWMRSDADAVPRVIKAVGRNTHASPDVGNFDDDVRYEGLKKAFPHAVTCDFKFMDLDPEGRHEAYDLKRCFDIGWNAGFRGPWCLEHHNGDTRDLFRELRLVRELLLQWIAERKKF